MGTDSDLEEVKRALQAILADRGGADGWYVSGQDPIPLPSLDSGRAQLHWLEAYYARFDGSDAKVGYWKEVYALRQLPARVAAKKGDFDLDQLAGVIECAARAVEQVSVAPLLGVTEHALEGRELTAPLRVALTNLRERRAALATTQELRREAARIDALLGEPPSVTLDPDEPWSDQAMADLAAAPEASRRAWLALFEHAATAAQAKPSKQWLKGARDRVEGIGLDDFQRLASHWFALVQRPTEPRLVQTEWGPMNAPAITERNADVLRGLVWACATVSDVAVARAVGDLATVCFTKIPGVGPVSAKVGNACVFTLGAWPGLEGVAQLGRLKTRVKYTVANRLIEKALDAAAERTGMAKADLEDLAVPTFGLTALGRGSVPVGAYTAELTVGEDDGVTVAWTHAAGGKSQAKIPADVARDHAAEVRALKKQMKDITSMRSAQRVRLERFIGGVRTWKVRDARLRFLEHALVGPLAGRLVWHLRAAERDALALWSEGRFVDVEGRPLLWVDDETTASLWHPLGFAVEVVGRWRARLSDLEVTQPFKQAYREIYILTDAELRTETYSNRFAAHVLRQHQLAALCRARGWAYALQGSGFDGANWPRLSLPAAGLRVEFAVDVAAGGAEAQSASGIDLYVATDQVRFLRLDGESVPLTEVPALVFSEVMRDVDLFVGVCSVGNDPTWNDHGDQGHADYWRSFAFGALSESAATRHAALERLLPKLKIADRCTLTERFLVVRGDLRTYKIHLGSANILMEPNDQYLCIVRAPGDAGKQSPRLPFDGDSVLSVILSKALLLAADTKIKDPSITRQIGARG